MPPRVHKHVVVVGVATGGHIPFEDWVAEVYPNLEAADTSKDDPAFWLYSSGSTGMPKGVVYTTSR